MADLVFYSALNITSIYMYLISTLFKGAIFSVQLFKSVLNSTFKTLLFCYIFLNSCLRFDIQRVLTLLSTMFTSAAPPSAGETCILSSIQHSIWWLATCILTLNSQMWTSLLTWVNLVGRGKYAHAYSVENIGWCYLGENMKRGTGKERNILKKKKLQELFATTMTDPRN